MLKSVRFLQYVSCGGLDAAREPAGRLKQAAKDEQDVKAILNYGAQGAGATAEELFELIARYGKAIAIELYVCNSNCT